MSKLGNGLWVRDSRMLAERITRRLCTCTEPCEVIVREIERAIDEERLESQRIDVALSSGELRVMGTWLR